MDIWGTKRVLDSHVLYRAQIGPLVLWLRHNIDEIHIAIEYAQNETPEIETVSFETVEGKMKERLEWRRWVVGPESNTISFLPAVPDRPVVVRPELAVKIPEGHEALFFVNIPVWVKIVVDNPNGIVLCKEPSILLSNIWFGDPMSGELCYSLLSRARRNIVHTRPKPHRAACPVRIVNTTKSQLDVDRFCVHVEYLNLYRGQKRLWTNEVYINFQGEDAASKIEYKQQSPQYEQDSEIITKSETGRKKTLLKKSLGKFKLLTGI